MNIGSINFLYFNLSDLLNQNDLNNLYKFDMLEDYEYMDKFGGFFFNIYNITKHELESFLLFFGADVSMLENNIFLKNLNFFFSLFYNQAFLVYFIKQITIIELYFIFSSIFLSKNSIILLMKFFFKKILLEVSRFFFSFKKNYKFITFKKFKLLIFSNTFFFDSNNLLYHYYYYIDFEHTGYFLYYQYYNDFLNSVFMQRLSFLKIMEYLNDSLIYSLHKFLTYFANIGYSKKELFLNFTFLSSFNVVQVTKNKLLKYNNFQFFLVDLNFFFTILHDFIVFFRFYLYIFYLLSFKNVSKKLLYKYFYLFKSQFFKLTQFYILIYQIKFKVIETYIFFLFFEFKFFIYNFFLLGKGYNLHFILNTCNFLILKLFNKIKFLVLYKKYLFNLNSTFIRYNLFCFNKLNVLVNGISLNSNFDFLSILFNNYTSLIEFKPNISNSILKNLKKNLNFSFLFKENFFFFYLNLYNFLKIIKVFNFCNFFFGLRTQYNYNLMYFSETFFIFNTLKLLRLSFLNIVFKLYIIISTISLYNILLNFYYLVEQYLYIPSNLRISNSIEEFFFFLNEETFTEDFTYFLDDMVIDEKEESDIDDAEDDSDFLDTFFDETELYNVYMFLFIEDIISINYYTYNVYTYKYLSISVNTLKRLSLNFSVKFDFDYIKIISYFNKNLYLLNNEIYKNDINERVWNIWISYALFSDLNSFDLNYYLRIPEVKLFSNRFLNYVIYGNYDKYDHLNPYIGADFINDLSFKTDDSILSVYGMFNENINKLVFHTYENVNEDLDETFIRDLVVLNDQWVWWDYLNKYTNVVKKNNNFKVNSLSPKNTYEVIFLNTYILSGIPRLFDLYFRKEKYDELEYFNNFSLIVNDLYNLNSIPLLNSDLNIPNKFNHYYHSWFNIYSNFLFLRDYSFLLEDLYFYNIIILNIPFIDDFFLSLLTYEKFFFSYLNQIFKTLIMSFYYVDKSQKSSLILFWEHFYLMLIELTYSFVNLNFINDYFTRLNDLFYYDENIDNERATLYKSVEYLYSIIQASDDDLTGDYLNLYLSEINNPYLLLFNGLNINVSLAEIIFFDLYESYLEVYSDTQQDEYDSQTVQLFKFFDADDAELRENDEEVTRSIQIDLQYEYNDFGFEYADERLSHLSLQFPNFFISENFDFYLKRYYSIYNYNFFLYGLFKTFLIKVFSFEVNLFSFSILSNKNDFKKIYFFDINLYKLELVFYYLINLFFVFCKNKYLHFNWFIFVLFYYYFIFLLKSAIFVYKYKIFCILFFTSYYIYILYNFFFKFSLSLTKVHLLTLERLYFILKIFLKKIFKIYKYFILMYNFLYFRSFFFKKYKQLIFFFFKNKIYLLLFLLFFKNNNQIVSFFLYSNSYIFEKKNTTFRSNLAALLHYKFGSKFSLYESLSSVSVFTNFNKFNSSFLNVEKSKLLSNENLSNSYFDKLILPSLNANIFDLTVLDNYDILKDSDIYDFEDLLDDEENFTDEWTADFIVGDLTDDYEEDMGEEEDSLDLSKEELNFELDLDLTFKQLVHEANGELLNNTKYSDKIFLWQARYKNFINQIFYINLFYIRNFFLNLLKYYKLKVPLLTSANLFSSFRYYRPGGKEEFIINYKRFSFPNALEYRNSPYVKLKSINKYKNFNFNKLINKNEFYLPKYFYTFDLIDILDYFVDFNNIEIAEFDQTYDIYNSSFGINLHDDSFKLLNISFIQLLRFFRYIYLYIYIYQYISNHFGLKLLLYSFFFFELFIFFKKYITLIFNLNSKFFLVLNKKYFFNKIYEFLVKNVIDLYVIENSVQNLKKIQGVSSFFIFFKFNYLFFFKKLVILKAYYINYMSFLSYYLLIKGLEYFLCFNLSKKKFNFFFNKIKLFLKLYELLIYTNAYKLAQIYEKYGFNESIFFFDNLVVNELFKNQKNYFKFMFNYIYILIFFF